MKARNVYSLIAALLFLLLAGCKSGGNNAGGAGDAASDQSPAPSAAPELIYGSRLQDGTYKIDVSSSSSMFRIVDAQLTVKEGDMTAVLTLSGDGYSKLYMGTGEEALADTDDKCVYFVENEEGLYTYEIPVAVLNQDTDVAAWSIKKEQWYDRVLVFQSALIPAEAFK
jgi:hypothetical protein